VPGPYNDEMRPRTNIRGANGAPHGLDRPFEAPFAFAQGKQGELETPAS